MSTGGPGGVKGTGPVPQPITTDAPEKDVELEGKTTSGAKVTKETAPQTPIQTGAKALDPSATKKLLADFDVKVKEWDSEDEHEVLFDAVDDMEKAKNLPDDLTGIQTAALREEGVLFEAALTPEEFETSAATLSSSSKILEKVTEFKEKLTAAWSSFVSKFRPSADTANVMAKGVGQLVDVSSEGDEAKAKEVVDEVASQLESDPGAVLDSMEQKGLHQVADEIRDSIQVANTKNLAVIKQTLMDHSENFPALKGMSPKARNIMINAALIAARIGNAGGKANDVVHLESRGYIIGKMPPEKMRLVETVLSMEPEQAIAKLEEWHAGTREKKGTNFKKTLRKVFGEEALEGVSSLFDGDELEGVSDIPPNVDREKSKRTLAVHEQKSEASRKTLDDRDKVLEDIRSGKGKKSLQPASDRNLEGLSNMFGGNELEVATDSTGPSVDEKATELSKVKRDRAMQNKTTPAMQEKVEQELQGLEEAKQKLVDQGGLTEAVAKEMQALEDNLAGQMEKAGASKEEAGHLAKGAMVRLHLAAWTNDGSSSEVTHLGGVSLGKDYPKAIEAAKSIGGQDLETVKDLLLATPSVTSSDFETVLEGLENRRGDTTVEE